MRVVPRSDLPRVLTPSLASRVGVSRSRLRTEVRRGNWRVLAPGVVLTRPDPPSRFDWLGAALATSGPSAAVSGWDGVVLHGVRPVVPEGAPGLVLVRTARSRQCGPVRVRRTDRAYGASPTPFDHPVLPLAMVAEPARCVADAARQPARLGEVRSMVARAVQLGLCSVDALQVELAAGQRNYSARFRKALAEVDAGARSAAEAAALQRMRHSRLPNFELNVPIVDGGGRVIYVLDVLWRRYRAALEIDSREYHFGRDEWQATMRRHNVLTATSLSVLHYPPSVLLAARAQWVGEVECWLRARAAELNEPYAAGSPGRGLPRRPPAPLVLPVTPAA